MTTSCRSWWRNCALEADSEILDIDRMEDHIAPIDPKVSKIRELIGSLEMCHHKAEKWAIDMLWTCHWNFVENLQIVLEMIGGNLKPERPFAACAWNISLSPIRPRMEVVSNTLKVFCDNSASDKEIDRYVLSLLGEPTEEKKWLAASLGKTIRLQLSL